MEALMISIFGTPPRLARWLVARIGTHLLVIPIIWALQVLGFERSTSLLLGLAAILVVARLRSASDPAHVRVDIVGGVPAVSGRFHEGKVARSNALPLASVESNEHGLVLTVSEEASLRTLTVPHDQLRGDAGVRLAAMLQAVLNRDMAGIRGQASSLGGRVFEGKGVVVLVSIRPSYLRLTWLALGVSLLLLYLAYRLLLLAAGGAST